MHKNPNTVIFTGELSTTCRNNVRKNWSWTVALDLKGWGGGRGMVQNISRKWEIIFEKNYKSPGMVHGAAGGAAAQLPWLGKRRGTIDRDVPGPADSEQIRSRLIPSTGSPGQIWTRVIPSTGSLCFRSAPGLLQICSQCGPNLLRWAVSSAGPLSRFGAAE